MTPSHDSPEVRMRSLARSSVELWHYVLDRPVGGSGVGYVDVIVVNVEDDTGMAATGFSYVLASSGASAARAAQRILGTLAGERTLAHPEVIHRRARESMNRTGRGPLYVGLAAVDVAMWDLYAKSIGVPLGIALGGCSRTVPVYGSGGLQARQDPDAAADQCRAYVERGVSAVKPRVAGIPTDRVLIEKVCDAVQDRAFVALDANEKCSLAAAGWLMRTASDYGVLFVEEPIPAHNLAGHRALVESGGPAIATGEHLQGLDEAVPFLADRLCSIIQPDLAMMGGLTECLRVARVAEALGIEVAPHFLPNLFVHLAAASPAVSWLEDFPLLEPLFGNPPTFNARGQLEMGPAPGHGLVWADGAREAFLSSID
jgi:L-alanine-DL-glutamate epimerase-like enolase superfamily enzyme